MTPSNTGTSLQVTEANCPMHGDYTRRVVMVLNKAVAIAGCPACQWERKAAQQARDEAESEGRREAAARVAASRSAIPERFSEATLAGYAVTVPEQQTAVDRCRWYLDTWAERKRLGTSMLFIGRPGTGKSHLACAIARNVTRRGDSALYTTVSSFTRAVRETYNGGKKTETQVLDSYASPSLLVLDEIGATSGSDHERQMLFELVNQRYEARRPTLLVSNLNAEEVRVFLGERIMDRLRDGGGKMLRMDWESFRK
jgi:DNA replication protein DnaC